MKVPESVLCEKTFAAIGSIPGLAPPHIIDIEAVGATAVLLENLSFIPYSSASGPVSYTHLTLPTICSV